MDRRAAITYGVTGQSLELYPPEWAAGVPSAATFKVWEGGDGDDQAVEFEGSATVDSVSTTLDGAAGAARHAATGGRRRIPLTATTNIVKGREYLVENANGQVERVKVVAIASGDYVDVQHDLAYDYASGATFKGLRMTAAVDATFVATEAKLNDPTEPYRVLWTYTLGGVTRKHWTQFDLVRAAKQHGVTVQSLFGAWPSILQQFSPEERLVAGADLIDEAWSRVETDLKLNGIDPNSVRDPSLIDVLVKEAAMEVLGRRGDCPLGRDLEQFLKESSAIYHRDLERAISGNRLLVSQGTEGEITSDPVRPGWFTS